MPTIHYLSDQKEVAVNNGDSILDASLNAGIPHAHACGGYARCSTCRVLIMDGLSHCQPRNSAEQHLAQQLHFSPDIRLACQTTISGDVALRRLVLDAEDIELTSQIRPGATAGSVGEEKQVAIMFADIRGFTTFAENHLPYDVVHVLNRYFHEMGHVINKNGGHINNYMGDGIMALFGVDTPHQAALGAVKAGVEMLETMNHLNPYIENVYHTKLEIGIGVHYGQVVVGAVGAVNKKRETAIGDAVNLASRIETANKEVGSRFLISKDTYQQVKEVVKIGKKASIVLKGKSGEHTLYEVTGLREDITSAEIERTLNISTQPMVPQPTLTEKALPVLGALLLGAFLAGFFTNLFSGNALLILGFIILGLVGAPLLVWGLVR